MQRHEIVSLATVRGYPCLTITLPTHRTSPDNRQDPIRLKNLISQAASRLTDELGKREVAALLSRLDQLADSVEHQYNLDGLALFVNVDGARMHRLPFSLPERVIVDETFFIRDLIYAFNRSPRYRVLALSDNQTRLFEAVRDDLEEIGPGSPFPLANPGMSTARTNASDPAVNVSQLRDEQTRNFYREVDQALSKAMADDPLPLALVGVDRNLAFFREVSANSAQIVATLTGNHDQTSAHDLGRLIWPGVRTALAERRAAIFAELEAAVGGQRSASTIGEVWRFAHEGRGATLIVEEGYHEPATMDESGLHLQPAGEATGPEALDDAVDEAIVTVLAKGGRVVFVDDGSLAQHSQIALILRY